MFDLLPTKSSEKQPIGYVMFMVEHDILLVSLTMCVEKIVEFETFQP